MKHKHHIVPRHAGGTDDPSNLVELTVEEHADAHRILYEQHGRLQDKLAWKGLTGLIGSDEIMRQLSAQPKSEEHKRKISEAHKGMSKPWVVGANVGAKKGVLKTDEHRQNISKGKLGKPNPKLIGNSNASGQRAKTEAHLDAIKKALNTDEVRAKKRATRDAKPTVICPHCGVQGKEGGNMKRFHFNNCKGK